MRRLPSSPKSRKKGEDFSRYRSGEHSGLDSINLHFKREENEARNDKPTYFRVEVELGFSISTIEKSC